MSQVRAQRRKHHVIYKTTCLVTGKWYIGLHSTDDLNDGYLGSGAQLWKSIKKHGKNNHRVEILEHCPDRATLIKREAEIVNEDLLAQEACMNLMLGGNANREERKHTKEETRALISQRSKEMWAKLKADPGKLAARNAKLAAPEHVAKRSKANTGKKRTEEQKQNLRTGQTKYYSSVSSSALLERGQKAAATRTARGTNKGGRPKGIPMTEAQKQHLRNLAAQRRALNKYQTNCNHNDRAFSSTAANH